VGAAPVSEGKRAVASAVRRKPPAALSQLRLEEEESRVGPMRQ
jgi:hypothetical protein